MPLPLRLVLTLLLIGPGLGWPQAVAAGRRGAGSASGPAHSGARTNGRTKQTSKQDGLRLRQAEAYAARLHSARTRLRASIQTRGRDPLQGILPAAAHRTAQQPLLQPQAFAVGPPAIDLGSGAGPGPAAVRIVRPSGIGLIRFIFLALTVSNLFPGLAAT